MRESGEPAGSAASESEPHPSRSDRVTLAALCAISLVFTTSINRAAGAWLGLIAPGWSGRASETCVASCAAAVAVYLIVRPRLPFARPNPATPWPGLVRLGGWWLLVWLAASTLNAFARGGWYAYTHGAAALTGFLLFGPLGEELLFRGAIFELAERVFGRRRSAALVVSTIFFSAHHLQLHGYRLSAAALAQMGFTLPMGWVFGTFRRSSGSLWPGLALHMMTNLPGAFGR